MIVVHSIVNKEERKFPLKERKSVQINLLIIQAGPELMPQKESLKI